MKVGQRLLLGVLPAILGVFTVIGLAYWGQYDRQAPRVLVIVAVIAAVSSLAMAWYNARYVRRRIDGLVAQARGNGVRAKDGSVAGDEIETIASSVTELTRAADHAREERDRAVSRAQQREVEYADIVNDLTRRMGARIEEAALPLHVLLSSPFGSLNENQEEMLGTAQAALDSADQDIRQLRVLLAFDRGESTPVLRPIGLTELVSPALAIAHARARTRHVTLHAGISDLVPRVIVDQLQMQSALTTILTDAVAHAPEGGEVSVVTNEGGAGHVRLTVKFGQGADVSNELSLDMRLARRLIAAQGTLLGSAGQTVIELPAERPVSAARG